MHNANLTIATECATDRARSMPYATPQLTRYGSLRALTATGSRNTVEGSMNGVCTVNTTRAMC